MDHAVLASAGAKDLVGATLDALDLSVALYVQDVFGI